MDLFVLIRNVNVITINITIMEKKIVVNKFNYIYGQTIWSSFLPIFPSFKCQNKNLMIDVRPMICAPIIWNVSNRNVNAFHTNIIINQRWLAVSLFYVLNLLGDRTLIINLL